MCQGFARTFPGGPARTWLDLPGLARTCLDLPGLARTCLDLPGLAWTCQDLPELAWTCQDLSRTCPEDLPERLFPEDLPGLGRTCLDLPGLVPDLPGLARPDFSKGFARTFPGGPARTFPGGPARSILVGLAWTCQELSRRFCQALSELARTCTDFFELDL
jgi:hypothetical protein